MNPGSVTTFTTEQAHNQLTLATNFAISTTELALLTHGKGHVWDFALTNPWRLWKRDERRLVITLTDNSEDNVRAFRALTPRDSLAVWGALPLRAMRWYLLTGQLLPITGIVSLGAPRVPEPPVALNLVPPPRVHTPLPHVRDLFPEAFSHDEEPRDRS